MKRIQEKKIMIKVDFFKKLPFLGHSTQGQIRKIIKAFKPLSYLLNQPIYNQGDPPESVYIVVNGTFEAVHNT